MKQILLTILRDHKTGIKEFRQASCQLGKILAYEASLHLNTVQEQIKTPWAITDGIKLKQSPILIIILRGGFALLPSFFEFFENAPVGVLGLKRNEITTQPELYYQNIPPATTDRQVIILDPTIATGGTGKAAISILQNKGFKEQNMIFVSILAARAGLEEIKETYPQVTYIIAQVDPQLNDKKFIVPGFGDFGDRYFGTE